MKPEIKFTLILGLIALGLAVLGYFKAIPGAGDATGNVPTIEIEPKVYDFGEIVLGDVVSRSFTVRNLGQEILEIKKVATSCACTTAKISQGTIEPGQEAELYVSYDSGSMPLHGSGREERIIYLRSNDPLNPQVEVRIYATVIK